MWIGLGIFLLAIGAILTFAVNINIPYISDDVLGWILMACGLLAIVLSFVAQSQRQHVSSEHVVRETHQDV